MGAPTTERPLAVVTGASSGIGYELAKQFAGHGYDVLAEQGFKALMRGDDHVVAGSFTNKVQAVAGKLVPDPAKAEMHRKMAEPGSAA